MCLYFDLFSSTTYVRINYFFEIMSFLTFCHTLCSYSRECNCRIFELKEIKFYISGNSTITLSWICTQSVAKGQDAHNLEKVVDPDRFQEKRYVIHYHQQIYKGGLFACQSHFFFLQNSLKLWMLIVVYIYPARKYEYLEWLLDY